LQVGEVASYALAEDGRSLSVKVFVKAPYDQYVTTNTRFWQASGIDVSLSAAGLTVQTQSVLSILIGGIAFETPATGPVPPAAEANAVFPLFADRSTAFKLAARDPQDFLMVFTDSLRGLTPGAPVEFRGIPVGEVVDIRAQVDAHTLAFSAPVTVRLDAQRLGVEVVDLPSDANLLEMRKRLIDNMVAHGVRSQLQSGNLLTGALSQTPVRFPTIPGELKAIEARLEDIVKKLDEVPLKAIGDDVRKALAELERTLVSARGTLDSGRGTLEEASRLIEPNSVLGAELGNTLQEVSRAARSVRILADYLERHPESLIRGKTGEAQ
jgi:paraquat-inducible protein B